MTLILAAIHKDGVCVCADKKSRRPDGSDDDNLEKIHHFKNIPVLVYNHGVNQFNGLSWSEYCAEYEDSKQWENKSLYGIREDFRTKIENDIEEELRRNYSNHLEGYTSTGIVFCGKTDYDVNFKIYELYWSYSSVLTSDHNSLDKEGLVTSGDGKKYLENFISKNIKYKKIKYWKELDEEFARRELEMLFDVALKEQENLSGSVISEKYDIESVSDY